MSLGRFAHGAWGRCKRCVESTSKKLRREIQDKCGRWRYGPGQNWAITKTSCIVVYKVIAPRLFVSVLLSQVPLRPICLQNKFKVLSYRFANITDLPPGEQFQKYPAGVYLYRASNNLIHVIKVSFMEWFVMLFPLHLHLLQSCVWCAQPSDEYRERMNKMRLFTFELCLERLARNRAKFYNVKVDKSSSGHRKKSLQIVMLTKKLAIKIRNYLRAWLIRPCVNLHSFALAWIWVYAPLCMSISMHAFRNHDRSPLSHEPTGHLNWFYFLFFFCICQNKRFCCAYAECKSAHSLRKYKNFPTHKGTHKRNLFFTQNLSMSNSFS